MTTRGGTDAWGERIWCKKQESLRSYEMERGLWQETLGVVTPDNNLVMSRRQVGSTSGWGRGGGQQDGLKGQLSATRS